MRGNVFINYRREDSAGWTGRLHDRMACELPARRIFIDVDNIEPGEDFAHKLDEQVAQCDVFLPVIGPRWLAVSDEGGNRRIDNPADFVRIEIASAIRRDNAHIIPVLVDGARMPSENDLPDELRSLVQRNALEISGKRFHRDAQHLVEAVKASLPWRVRHFRGLRRAAADSMPANTASRCVFYAKPTIDAKARLPPTPDQSGQDAGAGLPPAADCPGSWVKVARRGTMQGCPVFPLDRGKGRYWRQRE